MKVIGIVGMPASGKGEASRIARDLGIPVVVMGDAIREKVKEAGLPLTDANCGTIAGKLRAELGMDAIARITVPAVEAADAPVVLVDGIRGDYEVATFREHFPDFTLIAIVSSFETRYARLAGRGRSDDSLTAEELRARDDREESWGLDRALAQADCRIVNEGSLDMFVTEARSMLRRLGGIA